MKSRKLKCLPNVLTFCNMAIGILVICTMIHCESLFRIKLACFMIYLAVIIDMLDGFLARHLNAASEMGKQLDSFADFITFGVAPIAIFLSVLDSVPWYMMLILALYPLAGGFRLARYNLQGHCIFFTGLPITAAGFILTTTLLINTYAYKEFTVKFIVFYCFLTLLLSLMMICRFRVNRILKVKGSCDLKNNINGISEAKNWN